MRLQPRACELWRPSGTPPRALERFAAGHREEGGAQEAQGGLEVPGGAGRAGRGGGREGGREGEGKGAGNAGGNGEEEGEGRKGKMRRGKGGS